MILSADVAPLVAAATGSEHAGLFLTLFGDVCLGEIGC